MKVRQKDGGTKRQTGSVQPAVFRAHAVSCLITFTSTTNSLQPDKHMTSLSAIPNLLPHSYIIISRLNMLEYQQGCRRLWPINGNLQECQVFNNDAFNIFSVLMLFSDF